MSEVTEKNDLTRQIKVPGLKWSEELKSHMSI